jgi:hypothetical protein
MKPIVHKISGKIPVSSTITDIMSIAIGLMTIKDKIEPQVELLKHRLSERAEELNLTEDFKVEKLRNVSNANDVYLVSNTEINQDDQSSIDYYAKSFSHDERINTLGGTIDPNEVFVYKILEYTQFGP